MEDSVIHRAPPPSSSLSVFSHNAGLTRWLVLLLAMTAALALALRLPQLGKRPMHNDEAVNALKFKQLWEQGEYRYDPNEFHGPTLAYATRALGGLTAAPDFTHYSEARLRLVTVFFGLGLVLIIPLVLDGIGRRGAVWAALFTAISPALVFYSRYYIHETLLVFFTFLALGAGWRYWRSRQFGWLVLAAAALGLMAATKETFVLTMFAAGLAVALNQTWNRLLDASGPPVKAPSLKLTHLAGGLVVALLVWALVLSSFLSNPRGLLDFFRAFGPWSSRGGGNSPLLQPWYYYLHRLLFFHQAKGPVWTEALIFALAMVGAASGFIRQRLGRASASFVRFLAWYTFLLTAFYSLLAYKTPWCLLTFWQGAILLAGVGAAVLLRTLRGHWVHLAVTLLLLAGTGHLAWQTWRLDTQFAAAPGNPYAYSATSPDLLNLVKKVEALSQASPAGTNMVIKVVSPEDDYWPLPWYLRSFPQTGWWSALPSDPYASVMIVSARLHAQLDESKSHLMVGYFELRRQVFLELYVEKNLWSAYLAKRPPAPED